MPWLQQVKSARPPLLPPTGLHPHLTVLVPPGTSLDALVTLANACTHATILDLAGAIFTASSDHPLSLHCDDVTLSHGELALHGNQRLLFSGRNVRLQLIRVSGTPAAVAGRKLDWDAPCGLVHVTCRTATAAATGAAGANSMAEGMARGLTAEGPDDGSTGPGAASRAASLTMHECVLEGGGGTEACVVVDAGCGLVMDGGCVVRGHPEGVGCCVSGEGSSLRASSCMLRDNQDSAVLLLGGGSAHLQVTQWHVG